MAVFWQRSIGPIFKVGEVMDIRGGKFKKGSLECVAEAARLKESLGGGDVTALVLGGDEEPSFGIVKAI